jgi:hypothetical protein
VRKEFFLSRPELFQCRNDGTKVLVYSVEDGCIEMSQSLANGPSVHPSRLGTPDSITTTENERQQVPQQQTQHLQRLLEQPQIQQLGLQQEAIILQEQNASQAQQPRVQQQQQQLDLSLLESRAEQALEAGGRESPHSEDPLGSGNIQDSNGRPSDSCGGTRPGSGLQTACVIPSICVLGHAQATGHVLHTSSSSLNEAESPSTDHMSPTLGLFVHCLRELVLSHSTPNNEGVDLVTLNEAFRRYLQTKATGLAMKMLIQNLEKKGIPGLGTKGSLQKEFFLSQPTFFRYTLIGTNERISLVEDIASPQIQQVIGSSGNLQESPASTGCIQLQQHQTIFKRAQQQPVQHPQIHKSLSLGTVPDSSAASVDEKQPRLSEPELHQMLQLPHYHPRPEQQQQMTLRQEQNPNQAEQQRQQHQVHAGPAAAVPVQPLPQQALHQEQELQQQRGVDQHQVQQFIPTVKQRETPLASQLPTYTFSATNGRQRACVSACARVCLSMCECVLMNRCVCLSVHVCARACASSCAVGEHVYVYLHVCVGPKQDDCLS